MIRRAGPPEPGQEPGLPPADGERNADPDPRRLPGGNRSRRKRVVLADASKPVTVLHRVSEVQEQTSVGELVMRKLIKRQLRASLLLAGLVVGLLGSLPIASFLFPTFADLTVVGVRLPWLLLGVLPFPLLFGVGYWYHRLAERYERDFVKDLEN
jgi:hypothetical protein